MYVGLKSVSLPGSLHVNIPWFLWCFVLELDPFPCAGTSQQPYSMNFQTSFSWLLFQLGAGACGSSMAIVWAKVH